MKLPSLKNKKTNLLIIFFISCLSLFLNVFGQSYSPPGFNADEAAFGYNAYSILKTGKDEYGNLLPLRLKSFGDYKMPLYSYLSLPIIAVFGLSEESTRGLNSLIAFLFPFAIYFLTKELFERDDVSLLSSFLVATSLGLHLIGRQAHEAYLAAFLISLSLLFLLKLFKFWRARDAVIVFVLLLLSLFSYQSSRLFGLFFVVLSIFYAFKYNGKKILILFVVLPLILFTLTDLIYKPERVANLLITNSPGLSLKINEFRGESGSIVTYNKLLIGVRDVVFQHVGYYSPQFLAMNGDNNLRFGFPQMSPITLVEYAFALVGIYFIFRNKERWRYLIVFLILIAPLSSSLSWAGNSLTRSFFLLIPILILSAYGVVFFLKSVENKKKYYVVGILIILEIFFLYYSWDFYLNHYPKRALVQKDWQVGYRELNNYLKKNYNNFDKFYVTRKNGQPYIFTLFYDKYDPSKYQKTATLSSPDEYGFGQVSGFDKYDFNFTYNPLEKNVAMVGYPDDFSGINIDTSKLKKIIVGGQDIFWIYER